MNGEALLHAALRYADRGWRVLPVHGLNPDGSCGCGVPNCPNVAKHPRIAKWPAAATTDKSQILRWWADSPSSNIGILTGVASGLIVLDVDRPDALSDWATTTLTAKTGRGLHYYFLSNGTPIKSSVKKLGAGLDTRGDGGFVVAPPSRHAGGKHYEWLNPDAPIQPVPPWVISKEPIPNGERNDTLFRIAAGMHGRGEKVEVILEELRRVNHARCVPPLPDAEFLNIGNSVKRYPQVAGTPVPLLTDYSPQELFMAFPQSAMTGSIGELSRVLAAGTEVPEEFYFAAALTVVGSLCGSQLRLKVHLECEPRLYTVLLGQTADVKKSTALRRAISLFLPLMMNKTEVLHGVGSAEGLARILAQKGQVLLCYDEMKALMDKASIEGSALLAIIASMFENNRWSNPIRATLKSIHVDDGHLSLIGCCTTETYGRMWTPEAISIGLPNRLFLIGADRKRKVAWPEEPDASKIQQLVVRIVRQLDTLPKIFAIASDAKLRWKEWYMALPASEHAKRLDTLGFRLMGLIALTNDKNLIDLETIESVLQILDYELTIRQLSDPIDADNRIAQLEEKIRRTLKVRGPVNHRQLQRFTSAHRSGIWAFRQALSNLKSAREVAFDSSRSLYSLVVDAGGE